MIATAAQTPYAYTQPIPPQRTASTSMHFCEPRVSRASLANALGFALHHLELCSIHVEVRIC